MTISPAQLPLFLTMAAFIIASTGWAYCYFVSLRNAWIFADQRRKSWVAAEAARRGTVERREQLKVELETESAKRLAAEMELANAESGISEMARDLGNAIQSLEDARVTILGLEDRNRELEYQLNGAINLADEQWGQLDEVHQETRTLLHIANGLEAFGREYRTERDAARKRVAELEAHQPGRMADGRFVKLKK